MQKIKRISDEQAIIQNELTEIFISLKLSRSSCCLTRPFTACLHAPCHSFIQAARTADYNDRDYFRLISSRCVRPLRFLGESRELPNTR